MRQAFNIAVVLLLGYLLADRALMRAQAGETGTITCHQGAEMVKANALKKGFGDVGASSQGENFLSSCLVTGRGEVGGLVARD
ncbi:hypothetical protein ACOCG7_01860 [Paraburkholderia sp. DD10]|jgi:hypothetical protein|uniref:Uncharacterized protein n=1 Tax=Paraburkholderia terricola TaxID=169427 RepID=A0A1M6NFM5_9BURK|nr:MULTISPECIES: hypothetical protein [Paraburkholderia]AXE95132.1 hypothetical protein CUJ90_22595 [Paraburkholderia terricola]ORC52345.1 hypothetical protein B2G74_07045 [Burkholderia sp. A27]SDO14264.1 hypothetical protein SAMN05192547_101053 [Paraburkholderia sediminicola]SHJ94558.1 hypothetical protein SAMN05192548_101051 [Paraburkholderia terricola]